MAYADQKRNRTVAIGSVALVHAALGAALISGLAVKFAPPPDDPLEGKIIELAPPPPVDEPPPPEPVEKVVEAKANPSERIVVPETRIPTTSEVTLDTTTVVTPPSPPDLPVADAEPAPPLPPTPPVNLSSAARIRGDQSGWFPQDAYPAAARRAGAEGRVGVSVDIGANGKVTACRVLISSGNGDLDATTCRLATRNGRFEPAKDAAGNKVGSTLTLRPVRWRLEE